MMRGTGLPSRPVYPSRKTQRAPSLIVAMPFASSSSQLGVVAGFAVEVFLLQGHAEYAVGPVEVVLRQLHHLGPEPQGFRVTRLERHHPRARPSGEAGIAVEVGPGRLVEGVRVRLEQSGLVGTLSHVEKVLDEHPERRAPVADVVLADDVVAELLQGAGQRVADHRRPQVTDVHLLGQVGRGVVDGDVLAALERYAEARVGGHRLDRGRQPLVGEGDVEEAGTAHLHRLGDAVQVELGGHLGGHLPRWHPDLLGEGEWRVGLQVRELGRSQHGVGMP